MVYTPLLALSGAKKSHKQTSKKVPTQFIFGDYFREFCRLKGDENREVD